MCDTNNILQSAALIWAPSLVPSSILPYLALGVMPVSLVIHTLRHSCPAVRLDRLKNGVTLLEKILTQAKAKCTRDFLALVQAEIRFLQTERAVSRLESRLLETRIVPGWRDYLRGTFIISRALTMLEREVQDIEKTLLVLIADAHQRKLTDDIHERQELMDGVLQPQYSGRARGHDEHTGPNYQV
ncbi:hypothetical protein B0H14DRAFT_2565898 [Mycena olivaceomarginata]|nr:hypothetical protein B0H14DRAFT_2565898 [Mycena olivaceomarginata]